MKKHTNKFYTKMITIEMIEMMIEHGLNDERVEDIELNFTNEYSNLHDEPVSTTIEVKYILK